MSEAKLISPMLDGFAMGEAISDRGGVRCYPAMREDSDNKYIVKVISIPASQRQLDALLLTGAFSNSAGAMSYFKEVADEIDQEVQVLRKLSKLEGFLPYESVQIVPMEGDEVGYQVYLLSAYRRSLDKFMRKHLMTHLNAVNLGLDLCAAMAVCRNSGYLYTDLKPTNIFVSDEKEFRIGDLGLVSLNSLKYTALPAKYYSPYCPPEVRDSMNTLNETVDVFAIGMILYQVFNNGQLPPGGVIPSKDAPAPANADYEMAEIIYKACALDPKDRWQDPVQMGQALVSYMQRNTVNDTPLAPPIAQILESDAALPVSEEASAQPETPEAAAPQEELPVAEVPATEPVPSQEIPVAVIPEAAPVMPEAVAQSDIPKNTYEEDDEEEDDEEDDEEEDVKPISFAGLFGRKRSKNQDHSAYDDDGSEDGDYDDFRDPDDDEYDDDEEYDYENAPRKKKTWIVFLVLGVVLSLLCFGAYYFYDNVYVQRIQSMDVVTLHRDQATIVLDTEIDNSLLTLVCSDSHGISMRQPVVSNQVVFTDLKPNTRYQVTAEIEGFHSLKGSTSVSFTSDEQTTVSGFTAKTGHVDCSVTLDFQVEGKENEEWFITYSTDGEETMSQSFTGNAIFISDLTEGKTYTFTLNAAEELYLVGETTLEFTASRIILAEELQISAFADGTIAANWNTPENMTVESWTIRCYNSDLSFDETQVVTENTVSFSNLPTGMEYFVEVTAAGMSQPVRKSISNDPINIIDLTVEPNEDGDLKVSWGYDGPTPEAGWLVMYSLDNNEKQSVEASDTTSAVIKNIVPGATYHIELQTVPAFSVFNGTTSYQVPDVELFNEHSSYVQHWTYQTCITPAKDKWNPNQVKNVNYTSTFKVGQSISFIMTTKGHYYNNVYIDVMYVIRDAEGNVMPELLANETVNWYQLWRASYPKAGLTIPKVPDVPGEYQLYLYFNGKAVTVIDFTITE